MSSNILFVWFVIWTRTVHATPPSCSGSQASPLVIIKTEMSHPLYWETAMQRLTLKGVVHPYLKFHPFAIHPDGRCRGFCLGFSNPRNLS